MTARQGGEHRIAIPPNTSRAVGAIATIGRPRATTHWAKRPKASAQSWLVGVPLLGLLPVFVWGAQMTAATYALYALGTCVFFFLPGYALARALGLRCRPEELVVVALGLGLCASNLVYAAAGYADAPLLYALLPLGSGVHLAHRQRGVLPAFLPRLIAPSSLPIWLVAGGAAWLLVRMPVHAIDFVPAASGGMHLAAPLDGTLHAAVASELSHTFPPRNPLAADYPLVYHYASELSAAVFCRYFDLPAPAVCLRLLPTLFFGQAVLAGYALLKRLTGSLVAALITPLLIVLGEDFSYVPGLLAGSTGLWTDQYFGSPSVFGLYFANPNLPALAAFLSGMVAFGHAFRHEREWPAWTFATGALLALSGAYKVFFGLQGLTALGLTALLCRDAKRRFTIKLGVVTAAGFVLFIGPMLTQFRGSVIEMVPTLYTAYVPEALSQLDLARAGWLDAVVPLFVQKRVSLRGALQLALVALPLFAVGTLGMRLVGVPRLLGSVGKPTVAPVSLVFLGLFVICGYALGLGLRVTPVDYPETYNNSVWFLVESKLTSWVFVGCVIGRLFRTRLSGTIAAVATLLIVLLALPASINTFTAGSKNGSPTLATPDEVAVAEYFKRDVTPGAVVLCEGATVRRLLVGISAQRVPYAPELLPSSFLRRAQIEERGHDLALFWRAWEAGTFRADLAGKYHVDYVVAARALDGHRSSFRNATLVVYPVVALRGAEAKAF